MLPLLSQDGPAAPRSPQTRVAPGGTGPRETLSGPLVYLVDMSWAQAGLGRGWTHPNLRGRGRREGEQGSEAGNFVQESAPAEIGGSLLTKPEGALSVVPEPLPECGAWVSPRHPAVLRQQRMLVRCRRSLAGSSQQVLPWK